MPVELRKRKAPAQPAPLPPPKKKRSPVKKVVDKVKASVSSASKDPKIGHNTPPQVGSKIKLDGFGGEIHTHEGSKTSLAKLVEDSGNGVVLFTYPKALTPGCTKQACLFRDDHSALTAKGFSIYGLSRDSPSANSKFVTQKSLPYILLCDPSATLIEAIGLKKAPSSTTRGVFIVDKSGTVLASEAGSPDSTFTTALRVSRDDSTSGKEPSKVGDASLVPPSTGKGPKDSEIHGQENDAAIAKVASDVANSAAKIDPATPNPA